jgi:hypothetical protein
MRARGATPFRVVGERTKCAKAVLSVESSTITSGDWRPGMTGPPLVPLLALVESGAAVRPS